MAKRNKKLRVSGNIGKKNFKVEAEIIERKYGKKRDDSNLFAFLAAFLSIIGFAIAILAKRDDKYVMYYAKQSLVIFIVAVIVGIIKWIVIWIPIIGWAVYSTLSIIVFVLWLLSWIYALSGKEKEVPIVGKYAKKFKF